jgi:hypothetical protein
MRLAPDLDAIAQALNLRFERFHFADALCQRTKTQSKEGKWMKRLHLIDDDHFVLC